MFDVMREYPFQSAGRVLRYVFLTDPPLRHYFPKRRALVLAKALVEFPPVVCPIVRISLPENDVVVRHQDGLYEFISGTAEGRFEELPPGTHHPMGRKQYTLNASDNSPVPVLSYVLPVFGVQRYIFHGE